MKDDSTIWPVLEALDAALAARLEADGSPVDDHGIEFGHESTMDWDRPGDGIDGVSWVRLDTGSPTEDFPLAAERPLAYPNQTISYTVEVGVARTFEGGLDDGPMTGAERTAVARQQLADMTSMRLAICNCLRGLGRRFILGEYVSLNLGGIVDGRWPVAIEYERDAR